MRHLDKRLIAGWMAVGISTAVICLWAFWGIAENFHEGWYFESWLANMGLMVAQYLSPMLIFTGLTLLSIFWPRFGGSLHILFAILAAGFFQALTNTVTLLIIMPMIGLGALYWYGRPQPRKIAIALALGLPSLTILVCGFEPAIRVAQRLDDGNLGERVVQGNGVLLTWAPEGPGWPHTGSDWFTAQQRCQHLSEDGSSQEMTEQGVWRLPTVDEAVRSMARHGQNSGGLWDPGTAATTYVTKPDKESPLWNVHSQVIYWWTATEVDEDRTYIIVYDGKVWPRNKQLNQAYLGFRCIKERR